MRVLVRGDVPSLTPSPLPCPCTPKSHFRCTFLALPAGAYREFIRLGLDKSYLGGWMQQLGYSTTLLGKFLNEFDCEYPLQAAGMVHNPDVHTSVSPPLAPKLQAASATD